MKLNLVPTMPITPQSTNCMLLLVLIVATAALTSLGTTSPLNRRQHAMYLPCLGSHLTIWLAGSKQALVISPTVSCSWYGADDRGVYSKGEVDPEIERFH